MGLHPASTKQRPAKPDTRGLNLAQSVGQKMSHTCEMEIYADQLEERIKQLEEELRNLRVDTDMALTTQRMHPPQ